MRNTNTIVAIGIILIVLPVLGFTTDWKNFFTVLLGLVLCGMVVSVQFRHSRTRRTNTDKEQSRVDHAHHVDGQESTIDVSKKSSDQLQDSKIGEPVS
ncbi:MAG: hypothetical protein EXS46_03875 [Candidatus Taylorbacteria bacterium]|nr:hypothetical protein [Candidatus Taylorbacteria bacterium]